MHQSVRTAAALVATGATAVAVLALGTGKSFNALLAPGYQQELYGTTQLPTDDDGLATVLGGVAFAPDGDVWSSECGFGFSGMRLHRFDAQTSQPEVHLTTTLHPEIVVDTAGGCGLVNHPDATHMYSNSALGVVRLDVATGLVAPWPDSTTTPKGPAGNALGIAVDPQSNHVVYVGAGCHPTLPARLGLPSDTACTLHDLDPETGALSVFATLDPTFIDGIYFDPSGEFLFLANRDPFGSAHAITVLRRPEHSAPHTSDPQVVQSIPLANEPDGLAFHAGSPRFIVTNDEEGGTMTRVTFPGDDYAASPTVSAFAAGGFRGDLLQVGTDGCIYATQGRDALPDDLGTRYDDGTTTTEDSIVRICADGPGGFEPPAGVRETVNPPAPSLGSLSGVAYVDANGNDMRDSMELAIPGVTLTLSNGATATSGSDGRYSFSGVPAGPYTVTAPPSAAAPPPISGVVALGTLATLAAPVVADEITDGRDFGFDPGVITGVAYLDLNRNGVRDAIETILIPGVDVALTGATSAVTPTDVTGAYAFGPLGAGAFVVSAPASVVSATYGPLSRSSSSPLAITLPAGASRPDNDFGYKDANKPVCAVYASATPPHMTFEDSGSGLVSLEITKNLNTNFRVTITPAPGALAPAVGNPSAMPTGTVATFSSPTRAIVTVAVQRINTSQSAQLVVRATDLFGNVVSCDPVETTVTRLRHDRGIQTFTDIPFEEHIITVENGTPGLRGLDVVVNGEPFRLRGLEDGEVARLNVRRAMHRRRDNTVTLVPRGRPGESADVTIAARE